MSRTLICGSIAYDNIMVFEGHFKDHILPEQIHILNVAFLVPQLRREFGGQPAAEEGGQRQRRHCDGTERIAGQRQLREPPLRAEFHRRA